MCVLLGYDALERKNRHSPYSYHPIIFDFFLPYMAQADLCGLTNYTLGFCKVVFLGQHCLDNLLLHNNTFFNFYILYRIIVEFISIVSDLFI